jgi:hypothetical protein
MYEVLSQGGRSSCQLAAQLSVGGNTARATRRIGVKSVCVDAGSRDDWVRVGRRRQFAWESFVNGGSPRTEIIFDFTSRHKAGNACSLTAYVPCCTHGASLQSLTPLSAACAMIHCLCFVRNDRRAMVRSALLPMLARRSIELHFVCLRHRLCRLLLKLLLRYCRPWSVYGVQLHNATIWGNMEP